MTGRDELRRQLDSPGFLRLADRETALFVSDAPRRLGPRAWNERRVRLNGWRCEVDGGLAWLDRTRESYRALLLGLPNALPAYPRDARFCDVYELSRLLLLHPCAWECQPVALARAALKRYDDPAAMLAQAPRWLEQCAAQLRAREPLASLTGRLFAQWLKEQEGNADDPSL